MSTANVSKTFTSKHTTHSEKHIRREERVTQAETRQAGGKLQYHTQHATTQATAARRGIYRGTDQQQQPQQQPRGRHGNEGKERRMPQKSKAQALAASCGSGRRVRSGRYVSSHPSPPQPPPPPPPAHLSHTFHPPPHSQQQRPRQPTVP